MKNVLPWIAAGALGLGLLVSVGAHERFYHDRDNIPSTCADWDHQWFQDAATVQLVHDCIDSGQVHVNQLDDQNRTLLHRIARDIQKGEWRWNYHGVEEVTAGYDKRLAMARELLRWEDTDPDLRDALDRTALDYAFAKRRGWPLAGILLKDGATITIADDALERFEKYGTPMLEAGRGLLAQPLIENLDPDRLLACKTADCLVEEVLR